MIRKSIHLRAVGLDPEGKQIPQKIPQLFLLLSVLRVLVFHGSYPVESSPQFLPAIIGVQLAHILEPEGFTAFRLPRGAYTHCVYPASRKPLETAIRLDCSLTQPGSTTLSPSWVSCVLEVRSGCPGTIALMGYSHGARNQRIRKSRLARFRRWRRWRSKCRFPKESCSSCRARSLHTDCCCSATCYRG